MTLGVSYADKMQLLRRDARAGAIRMSVITHRGEEPDTFVMSSTLILVTKIPVNSLAA